MISIQSVQSGYDKTEVLHNLNAEIAPHKMTVLLGPNGCGKSTLLKTIGRIIPTQKGRIEIDGRDIRKTPSKLLAQKMAILPQMPTAPEGLTVEELVSYGRHPYQSLFKRETEEDKRIVSWAMEATGIGAFAARPLDSLSGGQKQRAFIALCLAQKTDIIMLDEPTTFLDISYQLEILTLLRNLNREYGTTIIMVLHDINQSAQFADQIVAMRDGCIIKCGTPQEVVERDTLRAIYDINARIIYEEEEGYPICVSYQLCG